MNERSTHHDSFVIERIYPASPPRVFAAWSNAEAKARWFAGPNEWKSAGHELDFRVGGRERLSGGRLDEPVHTFDCRYYDIVTNERLVYAYDMYIGEARISVSLATVEFKPSGAGTRLIFTEQAVFLDGFDDSGSRERGTRELLEKLGAALASEA